MTPKILCTIGENLTAEAKVILESIGPTQCVTCARPELLTLVKDCTVLFIQLETLVDEELLQAAPHLKFVATATTGPDHIDLAVAAARNITVVSLQGEADFLRGITSTAELAFGLILALLRQLPAAWNDVSAGHWRGGNFRGRELSRKTLGIVGVGRLGSMLVPYGQAFGMNVIGHDPRPTKVCPLVSLPELLERSDVVSLHVPLNEETRHLIDGAALRQMKPGAVLINTARGAAVDEAALLQALAGGQPAGYAADVLAGETAFAGHCADHPLVQYARQHSNVLITPHIGGMTVEARAATDIFIAKKLRSVVATGTTTA